LFSLVAKSQTDLNIVRDQWKKIIEIVGLKTFPTFLRYFLNTRMKLVSKDNLFKAVKNKYKSGESIFKLLDELEDFAYIYKALETPDDDLWANDKEIRENITILKMFRVVLFKPLLMISYKNLSITDFKKLLRTIVNISFRYNVIGKLQTNVMDNTYNSTALEVFEKNISNVSTIMKLIKPLYIDDEQFKNYFELREINTNNSNHKKILRYILYKIEGQEEHGNKLDFELDEGTLEHILPENDFSHYPDFDEESHGKYVYRIGNLTLLEPNKNNRQAAAKEFSEKLDVFKTSKYAITNKIGGSTWNSKAIEFRQISLAKKACAVWQIQFN
jgi:hypothetical protein